MALKARYEVTIHFYGNKGSYRARDIRSYEDALEKMERWLKAHEETGAACGSVAKYYELSNCTCGESCGCSDCE